MGAFPPGSRRQAARIRAERARLRENAGEPQAHMTRPGKRRPGVHMRAKQFQEARLSVKRREGEPIFLARRPFAWF